MLQGPASIGGGITIGATDAIIQAWDRTGVFASVCAEGILDKWGQLRDRRMQHEELQ